MSQAIESNSSEADSASATPAEEGKEEYTIRLNAEGQQRLVELIENPNPKAPSPVMLLAQERRTRNSAGTP